ncbi:MAG TPA: hypothetical protein VD788_06245, partial [Candidatus Polarisedimenticolaceae bacterium]|nr:hypothetical protein [Candidatus Polarisedimenticolaceae bacterium]
MSIGVFQRSAWRVVGCLIVIAGALATRAGQPQTLPVEGHREQTGDPWAPVWRERQLRSTPARVARGNFVSVQVNVDAAGNNIVGDAANEPSIAIDPTVPANIVIGWRQFDTVASNFRQAGYAYSRDAGQSWVFPGVLQPGQFRSDPVLAADAAGTFYYYSLSTVTTVEMFVSNDKGASWLGPFPAFGGDKEWMIADLSTSPAAGQIFALWNSQFTCCAPGTDFTRSSDGGFNYDGPFAMPVKVKWGTLDTADDGRLFVVGSDLNTTAVPSHYVMRSTNAPDPGVAPVFELTTPVDLGGTTVAGGPPNPGGLLGQVWIAADRNSRPGYVYVLASVNPPGSDPLDVRFVRSTNYGQSWSPSSRVNDLPPLATAYQWFAAMSVAPNGRIDV